jgi:hypothetical protein
VTYADSASGKTYAKRSALLLEEPDVVAARNGGPILEQKGALPHDIDPYHMAVVSIFQYFIGNTDFSIFGLHNIELVNQPSGLVIPIAYDFDFAGAINSTYAVPDPSLKIDRVRE